MSSLEGSICECGEIMLPPINPCLKCRKKTEIIKLSGIGTLLSYTMLHITPEGFKAPLILGIIELIVNFNNTKLITNKYNNPKIVCQGKLDEDELKIGLTVQVSKSEDVYNFIKIN